MRIHILGIGGVFMGNLALLLRDIGYQVTGSDAKLYPPMSTVLADAGINLLDYDPAIANKDVDCFVIGNSISRGNPLLEKILDLGLPYTSGPAILAAKVLQGRQVIAVAGTHGKTTTTSIIAHCYKQLDLDCGYLIGGSMPGGERGSHKGKHPVFVIEADEYDTCFCDKRAKFVHYHPKWALINNLEFDHADIYPNLAAIETQFHHLVRIVPSSGAVIYPEENQAISRVISRGIWSKQVKLDKEWKLLNDNNRFAIEFKNSVKEIQWNITGEHNACNALGAVATMASAGIHWQEAVDALAGFTNVARRLERLGKVGLADLYTDFAHHPTAIAATLNAIKKTLQPGGRLLVVLHPASNTMKTATHRETLPQSLQQADLLWVYQPNQQAFDFTPLLSQHSGWRGGFSDNKQQVDSLLSNIQQKDTVITLSNGAIASLHELLLSSL